MSVSNRSEIIIVSSPRGAVEVVRQQWRSQHKRSQWEWVWAARRRGQADWKHGDTAREAIRQAMLVRPGKPPPWLLAAARDAEAGIAAQGEPDQRSKGA